MKIFTELEIEKVNLYIGCKLKYERLKLGFSQHQLATKIESDNTAIGRLERAEHFTSWALIMLVAQTLNVDYCSLFQVPEKTEMEKIVRECRSLETKLTTKKEEFYSHLSNRIRKLYK